MSTAIQNTHIEIGRTPGDPADLQNFAPDCVSGDWQQYTAGFDTHFQNPDNVRVIVTANNKGVPPSIHTPAVVGVVSAVSTTGFTLRGRNSDCAGGLAGFYFMAVEELGQPPPGESPDLRLGILQQRIFAEDCQSGDSDSWHTSFSLPFSPHPDLAALATGCNLNVRDRWVPAVGRSRDLDINGFQLSARNSAECWRGRCAFYYVAAREGQGTKDSFWIDSGVVIPPKWFAPNCAPVYKGEDPWFATWEVYFNKPFLTPPVVLVTCKDADVAVVGLANDVTTHGFTLDAFNSDCAAGSAQFYWVAIGCGLGCG